MNKRLHCCGLVLLAPALCGLAGTLETRCADVLMEEVPLGVPAALRLPDGGYYSVRNASGRPLRVRFFPVVPSHCERLLGRPAYAPVTNLAWIGIAPAAVEIPPGAEAEALVTVRVPDGPEHAGRHYEFWIQAEAVQGMGGVALLSRVRMDTCGSAEPRPPAPAARALKLEKPREPRVGGTGRTFWRRLMFWRKD